MSSINIAIDGLHALTLRVKVNSTSPVASLNNLYICLKKIYLIDI